MYEITRLMYYGIVPTTRNGRVSEKDVVCNKIEETEFQNR
ncbi:hypothetical protein JMUB7504_27080 [Staphylococcus aureus]